MCPVVPNVSMLGHTLGYYLNPTLLTEEALNVLSDNLGIDASNCEPIISMKGIYWSNLHSAQKQPLRQSPNLTSLIARNNFVFIVLKKG